MWRQRCGRKVRVKDAAAGVVGGVRGRACVGVSAWEGWHARHALVWSARLRLCVCMCMCVCSGGRRLVVRPPGRNPYVIPIGGSNSVGTWGYLECVRELVAQAPLFGGFTDIAVTLGSGGTGAGVALGVHLRCGACAGTSG
jgi:hypothetical protein